MERIFRALTLAGVVSLASCGTVKPGPATSPVAGSLASGMETSTSRTMADEVRGLLPSGTEVLSLSRGDINADARPDVVVAVDGSSGDAKTPRSILLFVRDAEGQLRLAARNDHIVPCAECGGSLGEPGVHLVSRSGSFVLRTEGGTGWHWSNEYSFEHAGSDRWQLVSVSRTRTHRTSHETSSSTRTPGDFGQVDFVDFNPETIDDTSLPRE